MIKAELILDGETFRATSFQEIENLCKFSLLSTKMMGNCWEKQIVELMVFEQYAGAAAEDVLLISYEHVDLPLSEWS